MADEGKVADVRDLALPAVIAIAVPGAAFALMGVMPLMVFVVAFGGGFVLYMANLWRTPIDTTKILVPYLLTSAFFVVHVFEEYLTDFQDVVSQLSGQPVSQENFLMVAGVFMPVFLFVGAALILKRWRVGDYMLVMFFFAMVVAELAHFVFPFVIDGTFHYVSGMYTAAIPLIPAAYGLRVMLREIRGRRARGV